MNRFFHFFWLFSPVLALEPQGTGPTDQNSSLKWSDWGADHNGLKCQAALPAIVERNQPIEGILRCRAAPSLPDSIKATNPCYDMCTHFSLHLVDSSGKEISLKADTRTFGPSMVDWGKQAMSLKDGAILEWKFTFSPLREEVAAISEGNYRSFVRFEQENNPHPYWHRSQAEWFEQQYWHGRVDSGLLDFSIKPEIPRTQTILVPAKLSVARIVYPGDIGHASPPRVGKTEHLITTFTRENADEIVVAVRNGHWIATSILARTGDGKEKSRTLRGGPTEVGGDLDQWHQYYGGDIHAYYEIVVFESCADNPRNAGPGACGLQELWRGTLEVKATEAEIANAPIREISPRFGP